MALLRAHDLQDSLNIFTYIDDDRALSRARAIDDEIAAGRATGPLAGMPVALKDLIDHEGRVTTCGSAFYRRTADTTAPCVSRLEQAGAVVIGRTGLHEFAFGFSSENPHWGPVRNPWDPSTSTGGSSGGSAAAVAAGITPIAIGTDTGGSVRVPAGLCGTFGLKVSYGRIPLEGVFPLVGSVDTVGPLARSVDGLAWAYRAMSGDTAPEPPRTTKRIGIPDPWVEDAPAEPEIRTAFESAADSIESMGHEVRTIRSRSLVPSFQIWNAIAEEVTDVHSGFRAAGSEYGEDVGQRLEDAALVTADQTRRAREWQSDLRRSFADVFEELDFLITPTVAVRKKVIGQDQIDGRHYRSVISYFSALVNQALHPAIALPLAGSGAPPASLQVIGPMESEIDLIAFGRWLEENDLVDFSSSPVKST